MRGSLFWQGCLLAVLICATCCCRTPPVDEEFNPIVEASLKHCAANSAGVLGDGSICIALEIGDGHVYWCRFVPLEENLAMPGVIEYPELEVLVADANDESGRKSIWSGKANGLTGKKVFSVARLSVDENVRKVAGVIFEIPVNENAPIFLR